MGRGCTVLAVACVVIAVMAYSLTVPVPDGMPASWKTQFILSTTAFSMNVVSKCNYYDIYVYYMFHRSHFCCVVMSQCKTKGKST